MRGRLGSDAADFDAQGFSGHSFERRGVARGGPQLELDVARRSQLQQVVVAAVVQLQPHDRLGVAAIQAFSEAKNRGKRAHGAPLAAPEIAEAVVPPLRRRLAMVAGNQRNRFDLVRLEAAQVAVLDQVVRVFVVSFVADVHTQVVQDRGVLQPLALAVRETVNRARVIEESDRQPRHLLRVLGPEVAALGQLEDAPPPDIGVAIGLRDLLAVARDVVEDESLAQGQVAQRDLVGAETAENLIEQNRAGHREVGAAWLEPRDAQPLFEIQRHQLLARAAQRLGADAATAERRAFGEPLGGGGHRAKTENGARRADDPIEPGPLDLIEVFADFRVDVARQFAFVAGLQGIRADESFGQPDHPEFEAATELDRRSGSSRHLDAAAADVDDHGDVPGDVDAVHRGEMDESRLFRPRDDPGPYPGLLGDCLEKFPAVFRLACRARGYRNHLVNAVRFGQTPEFREHLERGVHSVRRELSPVQSAGAQADHFLFPVNHFEGQVWADLDHDHVDGIRADVDGGQSHGPVL